MKSSTSKSRIPHRALAVVGALAAAAITVGSTTASANPITTAAVKTEVTVCVVDTSGRSFDIVTTKTGTPSSSSTLVTGGTVNVAAGTCKLVATSLTSGNVDNFTTTIQLAGATLDHSDCLNVFNEFNTACSGIPGVAVNVYANAFHGFVVQYTLVALPPPPPVVTGCTVTRGFIRNQLDLLTNGIGKDIGPIVINGVTLTDAQILAAVSTPGGGLIQLKAQLVTALANISLGATTNTAVNAAIVSAQLLLATKSTDKTKIGAAITTLTNFNEGEGLAGVGASLHCTDAQEAVLKDKAPV